MKVSGVVVLYHPSQENIDNVNNYIDSLDKLYIVDNSEDDIVRVENNNIIEYIKFNNNEGIAHALNVGAEQAIKDGFDYLLTMDQDSHITNDIVEKMKKFLDKNHKENIGLISPFHDINSNEEKNGDIEERIEVMTSGNMINLSAYKKIGGFKDWLFIDCVDTEYCMNLNKNGYKVLRLNKICMKHELGNLEIHRLFGKEYPCYNHSPVRRYYMVRNALYINDMYKDLYPDYCSWLLRVQKGQVKRIIAFEKNKLKKLKMMYKGYKDYKKGIVGKLKY